MSELNTNSYIPGEIPNGLFGVNAFNMVSGVSGMSGVEMLDKLTKPNA